ncbi:MAG: helix-turn-helix transcriptional regulator [Clostridia bacterium]|nr:helix-turn-helix transcriptional regulator [Clostridia bacterium]
MYQQFVLKKSINVNSIFTAYDDIKRFDFVFNGEQHDFWELVYVASGKIGATADNRVYELSEGQIIFHKPMEFHKLWSSGGTEPHVIILSFDADGPGMKRFENSIFLMPPDGSDELFKIFEEIDTVFDRRSDFSLQLKENYDEYAVNMLALRMEMLLIKILNGTKQTVREDHHAGAEIYRKIISVMNENIGENLTISQIADICHISESYLKKIFTKYSGCGAAKYFLRLKISRACTMLLNGASVSKISDSLSFGNQQYFSTVFKRETGYSPTAYKKHILIEGNRDTRR